MTESIVARAEAYYRAFNDKDIDGVARRLHPNAALVSPLAQLAGKAAIVEAAGGLMRQLVSLTVRSRFGSGNQAMLVYDLVVADPIGRVPAAALMTFEGELIARIELFFDARPFEKAAPR